MPSGSSVCLIESSPRTIADSSLCHDPGIAIDHERLVYAAKDAGVSKLQLRKSSLYFFDERISSTNNDFLGIMSAVQSRRKTRRRQIREVHGVPLQYNLHDDQLGDIFAVSIRTKGAAEIRNDIFENLFNLVTEGVSGKAIVALSPADLLASAVLAHEVRHIAQQRWSQLPSSLFAGVYDCHFAEPDARTYAANCIMRGFNNPWLDVVQFNGTN